MNALLVRFEGRREAGPWTGSFVPTDVNVAAGFGLIEHDNVIGVEWLANGLVVGREAEDIVITLAPLRCILKSVIVIRDSRAVAKVTGVTWALDPLVGAKLDETDVVSHT